MSITRTIDDIAVEISPQANTATLRRDDQQITFLVTEYFDTLRDPFDSTGLVRENIENGVELRIDDQKITLTNTQEERLSRLFMSHQRQLLT